MGFRFRKVFKLLPGVSFNINKKSTSVSLGPRGLKTTIGSKGTRSTVGLPGTGLSYTTYTSNVQESAQRTRQTVPYSTQRSEQLIHEAIAEGDIEKAHAFEVFSHLSVEELMYIRNQAKAKGKSKTLARILAFFGAALGLQRFYVGDYKIGALFFFAFLFLGKSGLFVIPWIYDLVMIGKKVDEYNGNLCVKLAEDYLASKVTGYR